MFRVAIGLLVVALIAAVFGFGGIAGTATGLAKIVFVVALVLAVIGFLMGGRGTSALAVLVALSLPGLARAQDTSGDVERETRSGATFGLGIGGGHMGCSDSGGDDCDGDGANEAAGLSLHAGFLVAPNVAVIGDLWGMSHTDDRLTVSQGILAAAVRFWPAQRLWLQGGLGVARAQVNYDAEIFEVESRSDTVPAAIAGIGFEVISLPGFALDIELRGGTGLYEDELNVYNVSLGAGVSWF